MNSPIQGSALMLRAISFAAGKHRDQRRKDPERTPYINHPIEVAHILWFEGGIQDQYVLAGAVLHDTVEDTPTTFEELEREFGTKVSDIVREVTDDKDKPKAERKRLQVEHAPHLTKEARLVKIGDKISNLRDISRSAPRGWTHKRTIAYFDWSKAVIDGLRGTDAGLEAIFDQVYSTFMDAQQTVF